MRLYSYVLPYLLLVSFYTGTLADFDDRKVQVINSSPYQGVAVSLVGAYDIAPPSPERWSAASSRLQQTARKHIWPWIYFNRFIGYEEGGRAHSPLAAVHYFQRIRGFDLDNATGALADFYAIWRQALRLAKEWGAPGILVDAEPYNNYQTSKVAYLAQKTGRSETEVIRRLRAIGAELAALVHQEYPEAVLWFLFTGLITPPPGVAVGEERSVTHIVRGMLEWGKTNGAKFLLVSGGELSGGYCYRSLAELEQTYQTRRTRYLDLLTAYPNLRLGGTIAPWDRPEQKKDWLRRGPCGAAPWNSVHDFTPLIRQLLKSCDFVWIYAAGAASYNPYDPAIFPVYNNMLQAALRAAQN